MQFELKPAEVAIRIFIKTHVLGQFLGIEAPAFRISGDSAELAEGRHVLQFGLDGALQMVAGNTFMIE